MNVEMLYDLGITLVFAGILITLIAVVSMFVSGVREKGKVKGGGAIVIGPFPIVFGTDKRSIKAVLLLSITLTILLTIVAVIFYLISK